ncbi:lantibiotic dehydratase [Streptomyces sp. NPDC058471]|uniref:lantibiotic dehydratase n=1 Tax=Streptomyces sp. NPDC058471 TaxID=3346516 RepID=UPI00365E74F6
MSATRQRLGYRCAPLAVIRAAVGTNIEIPPWPDLADATPSGVDAWKTWLCATWAIPELADAVGHASPSLAERLDALSAGHALAVDEIRKLLHSLTAYCLRIARRATPFGLFAGVSEAHFGTKTSMRWGKEHRAVARADGRWLSEIIAQLEAVPALRRRLRLQANNVLTVRGDRLVVPWKARSLQSTGTAVQEVTLRNTPVVRTVVELTTAPTAYQQVVHDLVVQHGDISDAAAHELLDELIARGVLLSSLHPPATVPDALGYVLIQLDQAGAEHVPDAAKLAAELREVHALLAEHNRIPALDGIRQRAQLSARMAPLTTTAAPLALDLHLDAAATLPRQVAWEAQSALALLARISPQPYGKPEWIAYREKFLDRYGPGRLVPLMELVNPATGIGLPDAFHGTPPASRPSLSRRGCVLLALAQHAAAEHRSIEVDEGLIEQLAIGDPAKMTVPPHTELLAEVHASSVEALDAGRFRLAVRDVSRGWGNMTGGRLAALFDSGPEASDLLGTLARRPTSVAGALPVQLSFPALPPHAAHITRTPQLVAPLISFSEHRQAGPNTIALSDLAVLCDGNQLHLVSASRGQVLEAATPHPLQIECQTPTVARFCDELVRGQSTRLTGPAGQSLPFDWGVARHLPQLPRIEYGRTILSPASWRLTSAGLPGRAAAADEWEDAFAALRERWSLPRSVLLEHFDVRLRLDLDDAGHRALLRHQMEGTTFGPLHLLEGPDDNAFAWSGGRPVEIITLLRADADAQPAPVVPAAPAPRSSSFLPGTSAYLKVLLFGPTQAQRDLVTDHITALVDGLPLSSWWLRPGSGSSPRVELYLRFANAAAAHGAVRQIGSWADGLVERRALQDIAFVPYRPHTGQWGSAELQSAAEDVFAADTAVVVHQFVHFRDSDNEVLAAANIVAFATGLHPGRLADGLAWLTEQPKPMSSKRLPTTLACESRNLIEPEEDWALLRTLPGGAALCDLWTGRDRALAVYRRQLAQNDQWATSVLSALIDAHLRTAGLGRLDLNVAWRLARAAALARTSPKFGAGDAHA